MKRLSTNQLLRLSVFTPVLLVLLLSAGQGVASARVAPGPRSSHEFTLQRCDGNRLMHEATNRYRMFYDYPYAAAQRMAAATKEYRLFYDYPYAATLRMAAATDRYCPGNP